MEEQYSFKGHTYREPGALAEWMSKTVEAPLEPDLPIVDTHHHAWQDHRGSFSSDELLGEIAASGHNVVSTVFCEARAMYREGGALFLRPVGEVEYAAAMGARYPGGAGHVRLCEGIVAHADLMLGASVRPVLEALKTAGQGRLRGIRHVVAWDTGDAMKFSKRATPPHQLGDPAFRAGLAELGPLGLSFDAYMFYPQLPDLELMLQAFPDTRVVLDHAGGPLGIAPHAEREKTFLRWRERLRALVPYSNLYVKIGGLGMLHLDWPFHRASEPPRSEALAEAWRPYVETCIELFGVQRCMMESNFPVDKQTCGYGVLWNAMKRITADRSLVDKHRLYSGTAADFYRLRPVPSGR